MKTETKMVGIRMEKAAVEALKVMAEKWGVSQGRAVSMLVLGERVENRGVERGTASSVEVATKRDRFEALKAQFSGSVKLEAGEKDLSETPCAPFDFNEKESGEPHRVTQMGKRLGLYYLGGGEPVFSRYLVEGELEKFWEQRKKD